MQYFEKTLALIGYSIALALINYAIMVLLYNRTYSDLIKARIPRYTLLSREVGITRQEYNKRVYQGMDESMKMMAYAAKPIVFQFFILAFALLPLPKHYGGYKVGINLFGWEPGWFTFYFISYVSAVTILNAFKVKERLSVRHEQGVIALW